MTKFNLEKEAARVKFVLEKRKLPEMKAAVGITLDISGSTQGLYESGQIQRVVQQIIPVGLRFDDNGNLDVRTFSDRDKIAEITGATADNYEGFVEREILEDEAVPKWGGTWYSPIIKSMLEKYGFYGSEKEATVSKGFFKRMFGGDSATNNSKHLRPQSDSGEAVINYFITDGRNDDEEATVKLLQECEDAKVNMYFLFIGVGQEDFKFLKMIANKFGNVGFLSVGDLERFVDCDDIYEQLLPEELTGWLIQKSSGSN